MAKVFDRSMIKRGAAFTDVADAVLASEDASDAALAAAGILLNKAASSRAATGVPITVAQRVLEDLEKMVQSQFDSRRALLSVHSGLNAIAKVAATKVSASSGEGYPWGPDSACPYASIKPEPVELRAVS